MLHPSDTRVGDANKRCHVLCSSGERLALQFITTSHRTGLCQVYSALSSAGCWNDFFRRFTCFSSSFVLFCTFILFRFMIGSQIPQAFPVLLQYILRFVLPTHAPVSTHSSSGWAGFGSGREMLSRAPHIYNCISSFSWAIFSCCSTTLCKGFA